MNAAHWRLRVVFAQRGALKYLSHLDMIRLWERLLRRAMIPLAYSHGFTPHPKIGIAAPLPVGFEGMEELLEVTLTEPLSPEEFRSRLEPLLPPGLYIISVREAPESKVSLQQQVSMAEYLVRLLDYEGCEELAARVQSLMAQDSIPWRKEKRGRVREYDLRPLIKAIEYKGREGKDCILWMALSAHPQATARPEEVLAALGLEGVDWQIKRLKLHLEKG